MQEKIEDNLESISRIGTNLEFIQSKLFKNPKTTAKHSKNVHSIH